MNLSLPIGVMHEGIVLKDFTLSRPRGGIRAEFRDSTRALFDLVALRHVVKTLGPIIGPNDQILRRLTIVDRDYIHAACTASRFDGKLPIECKCESCDEPIEDSVVAGDVAVLPGRGAPEFRDGRACYQMQVKIGGRDLPVVVAVPSVADDIRIIEAQDKKGSRGDLALAQVAMTVLEWDGRAPPKVSELRDMDLDDFDALSEALNAMNPPRLDNEVIVECPACRSQQTITVEFDRWLLPLAPKRVEPQS